VVKLAIAKKFLEYIWYILKEKRFFEIRNKRKAVVSQTG